MRWYLNPLTLRDGARDLRRIYSGGGPRRLRVSGVGRPRGWILPTSTLATEVHAADGTRVSFDPELPVPLPLAYGYRLARKLGVPVISELDPERIELELPLWCPVRRRA